MRYHGWHQVIRCFSKREGWGAWNIPHTLRRLISAARRSPARCCDTSRSTLPLKSCSKPRCPRRHSAGAAPCSSPCAMWRTRCLPRRARAESRCSASACPPPGAWMRSQAASRMPTRLCPDGPASPSRSACRSPASCRCRCSTMCRPMRSARLAGALPAGLIPA